MEEVPRSHVELALMLVYDPLPNNNVFAWLFVRLIPNRSADVPDDTLS